jgi:hypothetical protein
MIDSEVIQRVFPELNQFKDKNLADFVARTWPRACPEAGAQDGLNEFPFSPRTPNEPLINHERKVAQYGQTLAKCLAADERNPQPDPDILLAACLLRDVDKLFMYEQIPDRSGWQLSPMVRRFPHGMLRAMLCREEGLPEVIVHLVATHAGDSTLPPEPYEGIVFHYADFFAADTVLWQAGVSLLLAHCPFTFRL